MIKVKCSWCGKVLYRGIYRIRVNEKHFCDRRCDGLWKSKYLVGEKAYTFKVGKITNKCYNCGKYISLYPYRMKQTKYHFCGRTCQNIWVSQNLNGKNSHSYVDGQSNRPYILEFNEQSKEFIRKRDKHKCRLCGISQKNNKQRLSIHHIDYDKTHADPKRLVSLCKGCNSQVNFNRDYYFALFSYILGEIYASKRRASFTSMESRA